MIVEKTIVAVASLPLIVAVIDPSITSITLAVIAALVVIIPIWFKFKTDALNARTDKQDVKIAEVIKTSDGMKTELVETTKKASYALGLAEGKAQAEAKAAVQTIAEAKGVAQGVASEQKLAEALKTVPPV